MRPITSLLSLLLFATCSAAMAGDVPLRDVELSTKLGVGYAVRLVDMNDDQRLDIAIVDQDRILWLENPNWTEHVVLQGKTKRDNVCFAPHDINGDGQIDFAVGADWRPADTNTGGTIQWITGKRPTEEWALHPISEEPTTHRMTFAEIDGDGKPELIVVPLMGRGTTRPNFSERGVRVLAFTIPEDPVAGEWKAQVLCDDVHVAHNFQVTDFSGDERPEILLVSFEGVSVLERGNDGLWQRTLIGTGNQETMPNRGASEIRLGRRADDEKYIATIEPWHGHQVVVYTPPKEKRPPTGQSWLWTRHVLDEELKWGHAVACANLDGDADQELIIGVRDNLDDKHRCGVRIYDPQDAAGEKWSRQIVDPGSVAIEDLAVGDLNGDGKTDIVAVGRATHNVKVYWNEHK